MSSRTDARGAVRPGDRIAPRSLTTVTGEAVPLPAPDRLVHLQFRRFAGCPVCSLHLHTFVARHAEVEAAGVREVVVFHSTDADLRRYEPDLPFAVIGDPTKALYRAFGVESARRSVLDPRVWPTIVRAVARSLWRTVAHRAPVPPVFPGGGRYGLPADLLVDPTGVVVAAHYGVHADDQWSVDEVLALARSTRPEPATAAAATAGPAPERRPG